MSNRLKHLYRDTNQWTLITVFIGFFLAIPLLSICLRLFDGQGDMWGHITTHFLKDYIINSIILVVGTGLLCLVFGISSAWIVTHYEFPFRRWIEWLLILPLAIPSYIGAYAYVGLLGNGGTLIRQLQSWGIPIDKIEMMNHQGLIWVLGCSLYPYVYTATRTMLRSIPRSIRDASTLMGVSKWKYATGIALPLAWPAIVAGLFLACMEVLNDYGAAKYFGVHTFTTGIFRSWTMLEDLQSSIYLSALLVILIFVVNGLSRWSRGNRSYASKSNHSASTNVKRENLKGAPMMLVLILVCMPLFFGFVLPLSQLIYWATKTYTAMLNQHVLWVTIQSFSVALAGSSCTIVIAFAMIYVARWNHIKKLNVFNKLAVIGYVIPGAIIGIAIMSSSQSVIDFAWDTFGIKIGYIFYGSSLILIYAYMFRFLAVAYNPLEANSLKIGSSLSEASYLLGKGKLSTLWKLEIPLLRKSILTAFLVVFVDIMKELPLTLILKPYNLETLAVKAYAYADDERVAEAAIPALALTLSIIVLMLCVRYIDRKLT